MKVFLDDAVAKIALLNIAAAIFFMRSLAHTQSKDRHTSIGL